MNFEINGHEYSSRKLDTFKQLHLVRRAAPALGAIVKAQQQGAKTIVDYAGPMADAVAGLPEDDFDWVVHTCLGVVQRKQGSNWTAVDVNQTLMFDDIELPELLQILGKVVMENLGRFFPQSVISDSPAPQAPTA